MAQTRVRQIISMTEKFNVNVFSCECSLNFASQYEIEKIEKMKSLSEFFSERVRVNGISEKSE